MKQVLVESMKNLYSLNLSNCKDGRLKSGQFAAKNFQKIFGHLLLKTYKRRTNKVNKKIF